MSDVSMDFNTALRQAGYTAEVYLNAAYKILHDNEYEGWKVKDAIELAKIMATDFHTSITAMKMQEIRNAITELTAEVNLK